MQSKETIEEIGEKEGNCWRHEDKRRKGMEEVNEGIKSN